MRRLSVLVLLLGGTVAHAVDIGVTIAGEVLPGIYGRVEIGDVRPPLVFAKPVIIASVPRREPLQPIYLHVPPGHAKNWAKYCGRYNACSRPVYFVKSAEYEPGYREDARDRGDERGNGRGDRGKGHGH